MCISVKNIFALDFLIYLNFIGFDFSPFLILSLTEAKAKVIQPKLIFFAKNLSNFSLKDAQLHSFAEDKESNSTKFGHFFAVDVRIKVAISLSLSVFC